MRIKIILSYDGSRFDGFQVQKHTKNTVSQKITTALKSLNITSCFTASGRTDKNVHALNQVLHLDLPPYWSNLSKLKKYLNNSLLPHIFIKKIDNVNKDFHARYGAKSRIYRYIVSTKKPSVFLTPYVTYIKKIDEKLIKDAISEFKGIHNFEYFKKNGSDTKNFTRTIYKTNFYKYKDFYIFYFEANGYLRSQIRMMVSFLLKISDGKLSKNELKLQLNLEDNFSSSLAPPNGLYLSKIKYGA